MVPNFQASTRTDPRCFRSLFEEAAAGHVLHYADPPDAICPQRTVRFNAERPEGSHHLTEDDFRHISSFFKAPARNERFNVRRY